MRLTTRTFLYTFVPIAILMTGSFWAVEMLVSVAVRSSLRNTLRDHQAAVERVRARSERHSRKALGALAENAQLQAVLRALLADRTAEEPRIATESQLEQLSRVVEAELLFFADGEGNPLAGIVRSEGSLGNLSVLRTRPPLHGFFYHGGTTYQIASVPVTQGTERVGFLTLGEPMELIGLSTPVVLRHSGKVLYTSVADSKASEIEAALSACAPSQECEFALGGKNHLSLALQQSASGEEYELRSVLNVDASLGPIQSLLRMVFGNTLAGAFLVALIVARLSSRSLVKPISRLAAKFSLALKEGAAAPKLSASEAKITEVRDLVEAFEAASEQLRSQGESLRNSHLEFVRALATTLDARDPYRAGHSHRVSRFACAVAREMGLSAADVDNLRVAALLHDIGKIAIPDAILQKPDRLTSDELVVVQQYPIVGRRILQGVPAFEALLDTVELHHENWDGSGYPRGLRGEEIPIGARIVHVADAFDAMTSDRPYRPGMDGLQALRILIGNAGVQFDAKVVEAFSKLLVQGEIATDRELTTHASAADSLASVS